jgi:hypothetical protein
MPELGDVDRPNDRPSIHTLISFRPMLIDTHDKHLLNLVVRPTLNDNHA